MRNKPVQNIDFHRSTLVLLFAMVLLLSACTGKKWLSEGERYYDGATVEFNQPDSIPDEVKKELNDALRPEPNMKLFGSRPKVWFYHIAGDVEKEKGLRHFVKNRLGEKPVLLDDVNIEQNENVLAGKTQNEGFFYAEADHDTTYSDTKAKLRYKVSVQWPYRISKLHLPKKDSSTTDRILHLVLQNSSLKVGDIYSLNKLIEERDRISRQMKEEGFFYFQPDYLLYQVDSTKGNHKAEVYFKMKEGAPQWALDRYYIRDIFINANYSLEADSSKRDFDTTMVDGMHYITDQDFFKPEKILSTVKLKKGTLYDIKKHDVTLKQLSDLGVFQFVNIRFDRVKSTDSLDVRVLLKPMKKKSVRTELLLTTKSNNFTGPELNFQFKNRNAFKGAELLTLDLSLGYETQLGRSQDALNSYTIALTSRLYFPRYVGLINFENFSREFVPKSFYELKYELLSRANFYSLNSFSGAFGYEWRENKVKSHELKLININYINLLNQSETFQNLVDNNALLRESFEDQLIFGTMYSYTHSNQGQQKSGKKTSHYFRGTLDLSGNSLFAAHKFVRPNEDEEFRIGGVQFAQYARADIDYRFYYKFNDRSSFAMRRIIAAGMPFLNSNTLPYSKQFFVGGANSIRAFLPRSVGPGTFDFTEGGEASAFLDQSGELKIAGNFEYRYAFNSIFKGALFVDGGNVWLINDRAEKPGGQFDFETFWHEFAIGGGAGIRIDMSFILLRLDVGTPFKKPWLPRPQRWVFNQMDFSDQSWRRQNIIYNVAIGYPF